MPAPWRMETERQVDARDRVSVKHVVICNRCGASFELSKRTIRARDTHTCPEKP